MTAVAQVDLKTDVKSAVPQTSSKPVKRYPFDLAKNASERWGPILADFKDVIPKLKTQVDKILASMGITDNSWTYWGIQKLASWYRDSCMHRDELTFISETTGIPFAKLLLMQLLYEASAACTCIITNVNGQPTMMRTMDWDMPLLKDMTIELAVCRSGGVLDRPPLQLFVATTWVGCVGMFTVHLPDMHSIAINYRRTAPLTTSALLYNVWQLTSMRWPASYLLRYVAETRVKFPNAVHLLKHTELVAPCYYTMFNPVEPELSCVLTRGPSTGVIRVAKLTGTTDSNNVSLYAVYQTNCDAENENNVMSENILWSQERCRLINDRLVARGNNWSSVEALQKDLCQHPIMNIETIYTCVITRSSISTVV